MTAEALADEGGAILEVELGQRSGGFGVVTRLGGEHSRPVGDAGGGCRGSPDGCHSVGGGGERGGAGRRRAEDWSEHPRHFRSRLRSGVASKAESRKLRRGQNNQVQPPGGRRDTARDGQKMSNRTVANGARVRRNEDEVSSLATRHKRAEAYSATCIASSTTHHLARSKLRQPHEQCPLFRKHHLLIFESTYESYCTYIECI